MTTWYQEKILTTYLMIRTLRIFVPQQNITEIIGKKKAAQFLYVISSHHPSCLSLIAFIVYLNLL